jgi:hypothetical protein
MANYIARNHREEFVAAAKEEAGLAPMGSMETMECEAMVQDANLLIKQFNLVCTHVTHATGISFKMAYRRPELKELEGSRAGPEPQFGTYKNESDNGDTEKCPHWSTLMHEELSFAVENEVVSRSTQDSKPQAGLMFPEEIGVVFGLDHGQGAL